MESQLREIGFVPHFAGADVKESAEPAGRIACLPLLESIPS
jgi:hypothetical protein